MSEVKNLEINTMLGWALALILAWFFITSGYPKINLTDAVNDRFVNWGYSIAFARAIGIIEVICGILVLIPKFRFWSAVILVGLMIGAIYTHFATGIGSPAFAFFLLILSLLLAYISFNEAILIARNKD